MNKTLNIGDVMSSIFAVLLTVIGVLNLILVHPVPGIVYLILSFLYVPTVNVILRKNYGFSIPLFVKFILGVAIIMFTLGVSDLGDMIDKL